MQPPRSRSQGGIRCTRALLEGMLVQVMGGGSEWVRESLRIEVSLTPVEGVRSRKQLGGRVSGSWLEVQWGSQPGKDAQYLLRHCSCSHWLDAVRGSFLANSLEEPTFLHQEVSVCLAGSPEWSNLWQVLLKGDLSFSLGT